MPDFVTALIAAFLPLFVAINIPGILPLYIGMTETFSADNRRQLLVRALLAAAVLAVLMLFAGQVIFDTLGITLNDLRVGGGEGRRGHAEGAMDVVNIKISKFGGLTKARQARDLCVSLGIAMTIEDSWGGDIITAAISHLAHSTPTELLFSSTDFNSYVTVSIADGAPQRNNGRLAAPTTPGLGITPKTKTFGQAVFEAG